MTIVPHYRPSFCPDIRSTSAIALVYTSRDYASLAPAYDFFTTSVYDGYQHNQPGIGLMSRRMGLVELLPESEQQPVRDGAIAAHVAMKFLVPVTRLRPQDCRRMAEGFARSAEHP